VVFGGKRHPHHDTSSATPDASDGGTSISTRGPLRLWKGQAELNDSLRSLLRKKFPKDDISLSTIRVPHAQPEDELINVFIDFSNIYVSYMGLITTKLGKRPSKRLEEDYRCMDIENLLAIIERNRPRGKCMMAGSVSIEDEKVFFEHAQNKYGYQVQVLSRVPVQSMLQQPTSASTALRNPTTGASPSRNASSASAKKHGLPQQQYREQGVDEALNSQMLQLIITHRNDANGTIVLASGDGASTQSFQMSFPDTVEHALNVGFKVEIVSFKDSLSREYNRAGFREFKNQGKLRVILLDDYVDYLAPLSVM
jgi:hypothetical protein